MSFAPVGHASRERDGFVKDIMRMDIPDGFGFPPAVPMWYYWFRAVKDI
jgi:hypothetical protein